MAWFQVEFDGGLPQGLCRPCSESALAAINFRQLCKESVKEWNEATEHLSQFEPLSDENKTYYIFYNGDVKALVEDTTVGLSEEAALRRLNTGFQDEVKKQKPVKKRSVKKKIPQSKRKWKCPDCGKKFAMGNYLIHHLKNSTKKLCTDCGLVLPKTILAHHIRHEHGKTVISCEFCHQIFDEKPSLFSHINKAHGKGSHQCKLCGAGFSKEKALANHTDSHCLLQCYCEEFFENRKCYIYHQRNCDSVIRYEKSEYVCDHCGNRYSRKPSLRIHIIQKHLHVLPYVCETCGKRTSTIAHLKSHEKVHTLERKTFECHCGAKMRTELGFQLHQRIHTGERPYECVECGDRFLSASRRLDHIKRRHRSAKDMPHGCTECTARFVRPFELKKHYMSVHPNVILAERFVVNN